MCFIMFLLINLHQDSTNMEYIKSRYKYDYVVNTNKKTPLQLQKEIIEYFENYKQNAKKKVNKEEAKTFTDYLYNKIKFYL